jgi:hypothetical protein
MTLAEACDHMEALTLFHKTRISHSPSDTNHSLYWLEEQTIICRIV